MTWTPMPKIPRYFRDITITEKLDGTNAAIEVTPDGHVLAYSKNRRLTSGKQTDNHGFAAWVEANIIALSALGTGVHRGEWWGQGINRGYGLTEKRFTRFNPNGTLIPGLVDAVPVLYQGPHLEDAISQALGQLRWHGSVAAPGFANPEGIVIFHNASGHLYKVTLEHDAEWKGARA